MKAPWFGLPVGSAGCFVFLLQKREWWKFSFREKTKGRYQTGKQTWSQKSNFHPVGQMTWGERDDFYDLLNSAWNRRWLLRWLRFTTVKSCLCPCFPHSCWRRQLSMTFVRCESRLSFISRSAGLAVVQQEHEASVIIIILISTTAPCFATCFAACVTATNVMYSGHQANSL